MTIIFTYTDNEVHTIIITIIIKIIIIKIKIMTAVISLVQYLTDKGQHTVLDMINKMYS